MRAYKEMMPVALAVSLLAAGTSAMAGPMSVLDPYAYVQAPRPGAQKSVRKQRGGGGLHVPGVGVFGKVGDGISKATKTATSGVVNTTRKAGAGIARGSKSLGEGVVAGTRKMGDGIASGTKASGEFMAKGAKAVGGGVAAVGDKVADGAGAAGSKVAGLPKQAAEALSGDQDKDKDIPPVAAATEKEQALAEAQPSGGLRDKPLPAPAAAATTPAPTRAVAEAPKKGGGMTSGITSAAAKMADGTADVSKKVVLFPMSMGRKMGRLFGLGDDNAVPAPKATAHAENAVTK